MKLTVLKTLAVTLATIFLSGCFIRIVPLPGGWVQVQSGNFPDCAPGDECEDIPVVDQMFDETFIARPDEGFEFVRWIRADRHFFGCSEDTEIRLFTTEFEGSGLEPFLETDDVFVIRPLFRSTGPDIDYETDFECNPLSGELIGESWVSYVNIFEADGNTYVGGYAVGSGAPNGEQISALAIRQGGADQGGKHLNVFSNYESDYQGRVQHAEGQFVEVNVYQEYRLNANNAGTYVFTFDARLPDELGLEGPAEAFAFAKVLDPGNDYQPTEPPVEFDSGDLDKTWQTRTIEITVTPEMAGMLLQFGFTNLATNYTATGVLYDNVSFKIKSGG